MSRVDPTRTTTTRKAAVAAVMREVRKLKRDVKEEHRTGRWERMTETHRLRDSSRWADAKVSTLGNRVTDALEGYVNRMFVRGAERSYLDAKREGFKPPMELSALLRADVAMERKEALDARVSEAVKGATDTFKQSFSRAVADNKDPSKEVQKLRNRLTTIARTETVRAHAHGQLASMQAMNVGEVRVLAEFATTRDAFVCDICGSYEGDRMPILSAYGLIPMHPNCRCAWYPVKTEKGET